MPFAGLGGSTVPVAVTERATRLGIKVFRSYGSTEHPSITGCLLDDPEVKRLTTDGHALPGVEMRLDPTGRSSAGAPTASWATPTPRSPRPRLRRRRVVPHRRRRACSTTTATSPSPIASSDIIIRGGENISAQEIEELLLGPGRTWPR